MTDIVEQAARVAYETYHKAGEFRPYEIAQSLSDAGLLRELPTLEQIADAIDEAAYGGASHTTDLAEAVLALLGADDAT